MFISCSNDNDKGVDNIDEPKEYIVSIGMNGEILNINESPLTSSIESSGSDLYGVQVYYKTSETDYIPYAYGLFDDKSLMEIKIFDVHTYKIEVTMVVDGKNRIYDYRCGRYGNPFSNNKGPLAITNKFIYDNYTYMYPTWCGADIYIGDSYGNYYIPNIRRYYGCLKDYSINKNENISIYMKKAYFGVKFIANGLTEGKLNIMIKDAPILTIKCGESEIEEIFSMYNVANKEGEINETDNVDVSVNWVKETGEVIPMINKKITFKRNTLTTITINVKETSTNNNINISQESGEMKSGENITI